MFGFYNIAQWNLPEQPPLVSNHLTQIWIGSSVSQIAISETSRKRPPPISNHLSLKSRVVRGDDWHFRLPCRRFHCTYIICSEFSMYNFLWRGEEQKRQRRLSITVAELRVRRNNRCTCPVGKWVFCFPCPTFNSTFPLGKLERTERTSVLCRLSRKKMCRGIMS